MEKRVILAFALTFAILIGWNALYERPRRQARVEALRAEEARRQRVADSLAASGDTTGARALREGRVREAPPEIVPDERPPTIARTAWAPGMSFHHLAPDSAAVLGTGAVVTSSIYRGEISKLGGAFTSWQTLKYPHPSGGPVDLVRSEPAPLDPKKRHLDFAAPRDFAPGGPHVGLGHLGGRIEWLSDVLFERTDGRPTEIHLDASNPTATLVFRAQADGLVVEKSYTFYHDSFEIDVSLKIRGIEAGDEISSYRVGWLGGLATTEKDVKRDLGSSYVAGMTGAEMRRKGVGSLKPGEIEVGEGTVRWAGVQTKYFIMALIPERVRTGRLEIWGDKELGIGQVAVEYPIRDLQASVADELRMYFGPIDFNRLKAYDVGLEKTVQLGWKLFRPFASAILSALIFLHGFIPNYGVVIILISVLTKVLFYRLTHKSMKSMKDMQKVQPQLAALKEKYKNDRQKLNEATMKLYKENKINPLGGCLPLLLQMPVFIALFQVLNNTIELRGAPFLLWIDNLAAEDTLFFLPFSIPFVGNQFNPLPLLMGGSTMLQSALGGSPLGGGGPEGMPSSTAAMKWIMPIFMTVIFYHMPSGLVLYWFVNNLLSIAQQWYIHKGDTAAEAT